LEYNKNTGFVSLIGRPSSGKSTLINKICGFKISAVSKHPQTTQFIIRGIYNDNESQIIFVDTPGYHHFDSNLNRGLSNLAVRTLDDGDLILYLIDLSRDFGEEEKEIINEINKIKKDVVIAYNKIDEKCPNKEKILKLVRANINPKAEIEISAKTGKNIKELINKLKNLLPVGPQYYSDEYVTDQSIPFRIQEIVKEKVFNNTRDEIPHAIYVELSSLKTNENKLIANADIFVERESQKRVVIGKGGNMIKKIGQEARSELIEIFEMDIDLFLRVKVHYKWKRKDNFLKKKFKFF
jgi:GTP-binding protein Era